METGVGAVAPTGEMPGRTATEVDQRGIAATHDCKRAVAWNLLAYDAPNATNKALVRILVKIAPAVLWQLRMLAGEQRCLWPARQGDGDRFEQPISCGFRVVKAEDVLSSGACKLCP